MWEYCSVVYLWKGRGFTQEIDFLYKDGQEIRQWEGKFWKDFLNQMGQEGWELIAATELAQSGNTVGIVGQFKRSS
jgi:hypothetical protein